MKTLKSIDTFVCNDNNHKAESKFESSLVENIFDASKQRKKEVSWFSSARPPTIDCNKGSEAILNKGALKGIY